MAFHLSLTWKATQYFFMTQGKKNWKYKRTGPCSLDSSIHLSVIKIWRPGYSNWTTTYCNNINSTTGKIFFSIISKILQIFKFHKLFKKFISGVAGCIEHMCLMLRTVIRKSSSLGSICLETVILYKQLIGVLVSFYLISGYLFKSIFFCVF